MSFFSKCEYSFPQCSKLLSKNIFIHPVIQAKISRNLPTPASPMQSLSPLPFTPQMLLNLPFARPHSHCHSLSLDPHHLYRLVSLVSVSSLYLGFSICHQSYVCKSNLIQQACP